MPVFSFLEVMPAPQPCPFNEYAFILFRKAMMECAAWPCLPNLIRLSGEVARTRCMESLKFPLCINLRSRFVCCHTSSQYSLILLLIGFGYCRSIVGSVSDDHVALCEKFAWLRHEGSKDAINTMAKQTSDIQLPMKPFNTE
jgi:hypothetical protein